MAGAVLASCRTDAGTREASRDGTSLTRVDTLGEPLVVTNPVFGRLSRVVAYDSVAVVQDRSGEPYLHEIDLATGTILRSTGRRGEGPGEFGRIAGIGRVGPDSLGVYDEALRRLTVLSVGGRDTAVRAISLPATGTAVAVAATPRGYRGWVVQAAAPSGQYIILDREGRVVRRVDLPLLGSTDTPEEERVLASAQASHCVSDDGRFMAVVYLYSNRVRMVDLEAGSFEEIGSDPEIDARWYRRDGRPVLNDSTVFYLDCALDSTNVFALYHGANTRSDSAASLRGGVEIHEFAHDGVLRTRWLLPQGANRISLSAGRLVATSSTRGEVFVYSRPVRGWP